MYWYFLGKEVIKVHISAIYPFTAGERLLKKTNVAN
jgi:hypothetical protein